MIRDQEESEKYLKIAQKYLLNDDQRNALKYLYKSQQSFPSSYVKGNVYLYFSSIISLIVLIVFEKL